MRAPVFAALSTALVITLATVSLPRSSPAPKESVPVGATAPVGPAIKEFHPVVREAARHDEGYSSQFTVYRPADIREQHRRLPVVVFGNGGCRNSPNPYIGAHSLIAAHGFIVLALGPYDQPDKDEDGTPHPERLKDAITWAQKENARAGSVLRQRIDTDRIGLAGTSCGGIEAMVAGADPRVKSVASFNSGFFEDGSLGYGREELANLHTPTLFVDGGPDDQAHDNSVANYDLVAVPAVRATNPHAGHSGFWRGLRDGESDGTIHEEMVAVLVQWLDFTLNDNRTARGYFLGEDCGLCSVDGWQDIRSKNFTAPTGSARSTEATSR
ncbi:hypothetical protein [Streptomyces sp. NPDC001661]